MSAAACPSAHFTLPIHDDAMAPLLMPGGVARFARGRTPVAGRAVLVRDRSGDMFIREYHPLPEGWAAVATNPVYMAFEAERDGLVLVAVMTGYDLPADEGYPPRKEEPRP